MKRQQKQPAYRRLTWTDRLIIERLFNNGHSRHFIARELNRSVSSISDEIRHGLYTHLGAETTRRPEHYSAQIAQDYADWQATIKGPALKLDKHYDYAYYVAAQIKQGRSPDQITGTLRREGKWTVSTPTLYRYIDRGYIPGITNQNLLEKPGRKPAAKEETTAARAPKGTSIERRPHEVSARSTFGHWEYDSVIGKAEGKQESLIVLTERLTRYEIIVRALDKTSASAVRALNWALANYPPGTFKTITVDNGSEFQDCKGMEHDAQGNKRLSVYYCHPYSSCEQGSNERNNRIVRRFFPKGQSLSHATQEDCDRAAAWMNDMPRKILGYATARERFQAELAKLTI